MGQVFISYSRKDKDFVRRLNSALVALGREAWVDWKDIPLSAEWQQEILTNIEAADTFIFILSPDSVTSANCRKEIDHAAVDNKRMVPILYRKVPDSEVPETLARYQRIDLGEDVDFESGFVTLIQALDTDLDWVQAHTRLLTRAKEWERQGQDGSFLLRGKDLRDAEEWVVRSAEHDPRPTPLQTRFLMVSRRAAIRQRRLLFGAAAMAVIIATALGVYAVLNQRYKEDALARSLAGRSAAILNQDGETELAALLALEAVERRWTDEGAQALRNAIAYLRPMRSYFGAGSKVSQMAFSPDSRRIVAVAERDKHARIYEVDTGREILRLQHDAEVNLGLFSPDGRWVVTASEDKTARVWDANSGRQIQRLSYDADLTALALSPDGLVATGANQTAHVIEAETGRERIRLEFPSWVSAAAFSADGKWFAAGSRDGSVQIWNRVTGAKRMLTKLPRQVRVFDFSPDGETRLLIGGGADDDSSDLQIVDLGSGKTLAHATYRSSFPLKRAFFAGGDPNRIAVYGEGVAALWDATLKRKRDAKVESTVDRALILPNGQMVLTIRRGVLSITDLIEEEDPAKLARVTLGDGVRTAEISPDGRLFAVSADGVNRILEIESPLDSLMLNGLGPVSDVSYSATGRYLAVASKPSWVVDLQQRPAARAIRGSSAETIAFDRQETKVVMGNQTSLTVWDAHSGARLGEAPLPGGQVPAPIGFRPDGQAVLFSYTHDHLKTLVWLTGKISEEDPRFEKVFGLSDDARLLALRPDDHTVHVVEAESRRQIATFTFEFAPFKIAFGGNGRFLIAVVDHKAQLWELATQRKLAQISDFDLITSATVSPDGRLVATTRYGGILRFQLVRREDLIRHGCKLVPRPLTPEEWTEYLPEDSYRGDRTCRQFTTAKPRE